MKSLYAAFEAREYAQALLLLRAEDGRPLAQDYATRIRQSWESALRGKTIHVTKITFLADRQLESNERALPASTEGARVVFEVEGTSDTPCFRFPLKNGTVSAGRIEGRWYVLEEVHFSGLFVLRC